MKSIFCFTALLLLPSQITLIAAQTNNIALGKTAAQSSNYNDDPSVPASNAVDGNIGTFSTTKAEEHAWWQVELASASETCSVDQIKVTLRQDCCRDRAAGSDVEIWDGTPDAPGSFLITSAGPLNTDSVQTFHFPPTVGARYVRIYRSRAGADQLTLPEVEIFGACNPASAGAGGDPHFKLFSGKSFDFHGHCDLLLLESPTVADGAGLSIQVRSSPYKEIFSYISEAAIQIGDRVLTIGHGGQHAIDGVPQIVGKTEAMVLDDLHQYPVESSVSKKGRHVYKIHLSHGPHGKEEIDIREFKKWITVTLLHPSAANLGKSQGLLGRFPDGAMLGRDGKTVHTSYDDFGQDWQVPPDKSLLGPGPFLDSSCAPLQALKDRRKRGRRLGESSITRAQAMEVCKHWGNQMEDCINDVQISEDLEMASTVPL